MTEADKNAFQIILATFLKFAALDVDIIQHNLFAPNQTLQIKSE